MMNTGNTVQDFALQDTHGNELRLSDHLKDGKALLLFFPFAFRNVCTDEMCHFRDNIKLYNSLDANLLGISIDSYFTLREFKKTNNFPFPFVSDFNKEISRKFGVLYQNYFGMKGVSKRSVFVVNQDMVIEYAEVLEDADFLPDFKAIQKALEE